MMMKVTCALVQLVNSSGVSLWRDISFDHKQSMSRVVVRLLKFSVFILLSHLILWRIVFLLVNIYKYSATNIIHNDTAREAIRAIEQQPDISINPPLPQPSPNITAKTKYQIKKKRKARGKRIPFRRKDFGALEWTSDPDFKKVLLWTGYGPLQEGMLLWRRVLSDIGKVQMFVSECV